MKKLVIMLAVGILFSFSTFALGQATVDWHGLGSPFTIGGYYAGNGSVGYGLDYAPRGNWAVELVFDNLQGVAGYADGSTLTTFCLEWNEDLHFTGDHVYDVTIGDGAVNGGAGGGNPDIISNETAWVYEQYLSGNTFGLTGGVNQVAAAVQDAIWNYEDEQASPLWAETSVVMGLADAAVLGGYVNTKVKALNITCQGSDVFPNGLTDGQSVLVVVPVPGAVLLGGIGVGLVGWMRKRKSL